MRSAGQASGRVRTQRLVLVGVVSVLAAALLALLPGSNQAQVSPPVSFGSPTTFPAGSAPSFTAIGDLNRDGISDLVVANNSSANISILLGNGNGTFGLATNVAVGLQPNSVALGDIDGDGDLDAAVANLGSNNVSILTQGNPPTGNLAPTFTLSPAGLSQAYSVAFGDMNRDGLLDVVIAFSNGVAIFNNAGPPNFFPSQTPDVVHTLGINQARSVAVGDLNRDGVPDIVVANESGDTVAVVISPNPPLSGSTTTFSVGTGGEFPSSLAISDLNLDGKLDLAVAKPSGNNIAVLLGDGTGSFGAFTNFAAGTTPRSVAIADLNGDGIPDLAAANNNSYDVSVLLGNGNGTFGTTSNFSFGLGNTPISVAIADLNRDAKPDLIATLPATAPGGASVLLNTTAFTPAGGFGPATSFAVGANPREVAIGDLNRDGAPDLAVTRATAAIPGSDNVSIMLGTATGSFGSATNFTVGTTPEGIAIEDLNRDGIQDLAVANQNSSFLSILLGIGDGSFGPSTSVAAEHAASVVVGDLNRDGNADLAAANQSCCRVSILLGTGSGSFGSATQYTVDVNPISVATADLNRDGILDLAVANLSGDNVSILLGTGMGTFGTATNFGTDDGSDSVAIADLNRDGILDLAVSNTWSSTVSVLLGTGTGSFGTAMNFAVGTRPQAVAVGDLNRDGIQDLVTANFGSNDVTVLFGNGSGGFGTANNFAAGTNPRHVSIGDLNRDSRPDLAVTLDSGNVAILFNTSPDPTIMAVSPDTAQVGAIVTITGSNFGATQGTSTLLFNGTTATDIAEWTNQRIIATVPVGTTTGDVTVTVNSIVSNGVLFTVGATPAATADLSLTVNDSPDPATVGSMVTYSMQVTNNGPDLANGVQLTTAVPSGSTFSSITTGQGGCTGTTSITCTLGTLNTSASVMVTLMVTTSTAGSLTLTANATADVNVTDPTPGNNTNIQETTSVPNATFTVNSNNDADDGACNGSHCSLREAINAANASAGIDLISFNIGSGLQTIAPTSGLPSITDPVILDGTSQPGFAGMPIIELNGASAGAGTSGLTITAGNSTVRGLVINRFNGNGVFLVGFNGGNVLQGNFIGTNAAGTAALANGSSGVRIGNSPNNVIGGTAPAARNVISGNTNGDGIRIESATATGNVVQGNYIGTDAAGTAALPNQDGVEISNDASSNIIGGTMPGARNVISGNGSNGVHITGGGLGNTTLNVVHGNYIGTNAAGTAALSQPQNVGIGIAGSNASNNTIGGTSGTTPGGMCTGACNVISGHTRAGILIDGPVTTSTQVYGNFIGTDATGTVAVPNGDGIQLQVAVSAMIGGTTPNARNLISGNTATGVFIIGGGATSNLVQGNYIGSNAAGNAVLPNGNGVIITTGANTNTIGGSTGTIPGGPCAGACNVISGNTQNGVLIQINASGNLVQGNYIGTDAAGTAGLPNAQDGVRIDGAPNNAIGGAVVGARNVISGNTVFGISIRNSGSTGNLVQGNYIGTDVTGTADLGNSSNGMFISGASNNTIGGTTADARNLISGNNGNGIGISGAAATANIVQGNFIGTNVTGSAALGNTVGGVRISGASNTTIGGTIAGARNLISGNNEGVRIEGVSATSNLVQGNFIGTDLTSVLAIPNAAGVVILSSAAGNTIGGTTGTTPGGPCTGACNVISGNGPSFSGVRLLSSSGNLVQGNFIGTDVTGTIAVPNEVGVQSLGSPNNTIGGTTASARNLISGNKSFGVHLSTPAATGNTVQGNFIGIDPSGMAAIPNGIFGILLENSAANNQIGGTAPGAGNVISGNNASGLPPNVSLPQAGSGLVLQGSGVTSNLVRGNFIGTNATGGGALGNTRYGIYVDNAPANTIGGTAPGARNVISGNLDGIHVIGSSAAGNLIQGNYIGTDATGSVDLGNASSGVVLTGGAANTTIGGMTTAARNVISGNNNNGIDISTSGNVVVGNFIGTDATGTLPIGNGQPGVRISGPGTNNIVGGTTPEARNVISGNSSAGVSIVNSGATQNVVSGNFIGTDVTGTQSVGNTVGVHLAIGAAANTIGGITGTTPGGPCSGACNLISGNTSGGILFSGTNLEGANVVQGNYVGTDLTGMVGLGNGIFGVAIGDSVNNTIGGTTPQARNVIAGNNGDGIRLAGNNSIGSIIAGNFIGTDATGSGALGNSQNGVLIFSGASNNTIGGMGAGAGNTIASNTGDGVVLAATAGTRNAILQNTVRSNGQLGIDLSDNGATANDTGDGDGGPNNTQNFPVLTTVNSSGGSTTITGSLNSTASTTFRIEFFSNAACDPLGHGEGQTFLGFTTVTTDGSGNGSFSVTLPIAVAVGHVITATATDPNNNTSEFSACRALNRPSDAVDDNVTVAEDSLNNVLDVTANDGDADGDPLAITAVTQGASGSVAITTAQPTPQTERASLASDGTQPNNFSSQSALSADGRFVTFASNASNLVSGDTNGVRDVFVHDRLTRQTTRISIASDGTQGNDTSGFCCPAVALSANGRFAAFDSAASNLVPGDTNSARDVFVHDRDTDNDGIFDEAGFTATTRVSVASDGTQFTTGGGAPAISADGRFVLFHSAGSTLVHDRQTGQTTTIAIGAQAKLSADGRFVVFASSESNLVPNDTNGVLDIFVYDRQTGQITRVSVTSEGIQANAVSQQPNISGDGRFVVFASSASNLVPNDTNGVQDIFLHDRQTSQTSRISVASDGTQGNAISFDIPSITYDGRFAAFDSAATNLVSGDTNGFTDVFVHDRQTGGTVRVNLDPGGNQGSDGQCDSPSLSLDGRFVSFECNATTLVPGDTNGQQDVFVVRNTLKTEPAVTYTPNPHFNGADSFTYTIDDGHGGMDTATVNVTITPVPDGPIAENDTATVLEDSLATPILVLANDSDPDNLTPPLNAGLTITAVTQGTSGGSVAITGGGTGLTYQPASNFDQSESFTYTIQDASGSPATATVTVTITPAPDSPILVAPGIPDPAPLTQGTTSTTLSLAPHFADADTGDTLTFSVTANSNPTLVSATSIDQDTDVLTVTFAAGQSGFADLTITASDGVTSIEDTVRVTVVASLSFDVISNQTAQQDEPLEQQIPILGLTPVTATLTATSGNTTLLPNANLAVTGTGATRTLGFKPVASQTGSALITVVATDGSNTFERQFTITVVPDNDPTLKWVNLDVSALAPGQATFEVLQNGTLVATGMTSSVRGLALATTGGTYTLRAPAGCTTCAVSLPFTVAGRCDLRLP